MVLKCKNCGSSNLEMVSLPDSLTIDHWRGPRGVFCCGSCGATTHFMLPLNDHFPPPPAPPAPPAPPRLSRMAEAFKKFSDATIAMIGSKTTYDTGKGGNFADRMTSPVGWLHDASKYLHEVYQHCLGDTKLTKEEAKRNLYKVAHCCQLAADRL